MSLCHGRWSSALVPLISDDSYLVQRVKCQFRVKSPCYSYYLENDYYGLGYASKSERNHHNQSEIILNFLLIAIDRIQIESYDFWFVYHSGVLTQIQKVLLKTISCTCEKVSQKLFETNL